MGVVIEQIDRPDRWRVIREARLLALRSSPEAAGEPVARAEQFGEAEWRAEVARRTWFIAGVPVTLGMVAGAWSTSSSAEARLEAMWVSGHARRRGVGAALVKAVLVWAGEHGAQSLAVKVAAENRGAVALYRAHGFEPTGEHGLLPRDPRRQYVVLRAEPRPSEAGRGGRRR